MEAKTLPLGAVLSTQNRVTGQANIYLSNYGVDKWTLSSEYILKNAHLIK